MIVNYVNPFSLKAKSEASREDNPNWYKATTGFFENEYWEAMKADF